MPDDKLIFYDELRHEVAVLHIKGIFAATLRFAISKLNIHKVWDFCSVAQTSSTAVKSVHVNVVCESGEANVAVSHCRQKL